MVPGRVQVAGILQHLAQAPQLRELTLDVRAELVPDLPCQLPQLRKLRVCRESCRLRDMVEACGGIGCAR